MYDPSASLTSRACSDSKDDNIESSECAFTLSYGGDTSYKVSAVGTVVQDVVGMGGIFANSTVDAILREKGPWPSRVEGILGMAFGALNCNPHCFPTAFSSLLRAAGGKDAFAICFGDEGERWLWEVRGARARG